MAWVGLVILLAGMDIAAAIRNQPAKDLSGLTTLAIVLFTIAIIGDIRKAIK